MSPSECVHVVRMLSARCPAMRFEEATPDAWYLDLQHHAADDALEAVLELSRRQAFVSLAELLSEIHRIERQRAGRQRAAELETQREAEARAVEAAPVEPVDREELRKRLAVVTTRPKRGVPRTDPRPDPVRLAEARAEIERARQAATSGRQA